MGTLTCLKCAQTIEAPSFAQADVLINHAANSRKCSGNPDYMRWNGEKLGVITPAKETPKGISKSKRKLTH